jgi:hypothetical protein
MKLGTLNCLIPEWYMSLRNTMLPGPGRYLKRVIPDQHWFLPCCGVYWNQACLSSASWGARTLVKPDALGRAQHIINLLKFTSDGADFDSIQQY